MLESIFTLSNILTVIVTAICTWGTTFLFHRQKKEELQIANEAERSRQWKELYEESQRDSARKDHKIDDLRNEINDLRTQLINLRQEVQLNTIYRCFKISCPDRENPQFKQQLDAFSPIPSCSRHHPNMPSVPVHNATPSRFTTDPIVPDTPVPSASPSVSSSVTAHTDAPVPDASASG